MEEEKEALPILDPLREAAQVRERPFTSQLPLIGTLIARFRQAWNSVSTRWYVQDIVRQQNEFNHLLVNQLQEFNQQLIEQDHQQALTVQQTAELTTQLVRMNRLLQSIEQRLARLEAAQSPGASQE